MPTALVVGAGLNGLGVARSLGAERIKVWLADSGTPGPTFYTRCAKRIMLKSLVGDELVDALIALADRFDEPPALVLTQEASVRAVSSARQRLQHLYRFLLPKDEVVTALTTKQGFEAAARNHGLPIPHSHSLNGIADLDIVKALRFPIIVKPDERNPAYDRIFSKAYKLENADELSNLYADINARTPHVKLIAQEWINGTDADIYFCLQARGANNQVLMSFCGRKLRSYPPMTGGTASCTIADLNYWAEIESLTDRFFSAAGVFGMCSMEYKRDPQSGRFIMVEPTIGRTDYQEYVATLHGRNLPAAYVRNLFGLSTPVVAPKSSRRIWCDREAEAKSKAIMPVPDAIKSPKIDALFSLADPMPAIVDFSSRLRNRIARLTGK